eukprot:gene12015-5415_t
MKKKFGGSFANPDAEMVKYINDKLLINEKSTCIKEGILEKKSGSFLGSWQKRYFKLYELALIYSKSEKEEPVGMIEKEDILNVDTLNQPNVYMVRIKVKSKEGKVYELKCRSKKERDSWLDSLRNWYNEKKEKELKPASHFYAETFKQESIESLYKKDEYEKKKLMDSTDETIKIIIYDDIEKDKIHACTIYKLIQILTETKGEGEFIKLFLLTYNSFCTSSELLNLLYLRFNTLPPLTNEKEEYIEITPECFDEFYHSKLLTIRLRICQILNNWILDYFFNIENPEEISKEIQNFCQEMSIIGMKSTGQKILKALSSKYSGEKETSFDLNIKEIEIESIDNLFIDFTPKQVTEQLTLITFKYFKDLKPSEFLNQNWSKKSKEMKAPNLTSLIIRSNETANWVGTMIMNEKEIDSRVKIMEFMIDIASEAIELHNYNLMLEIISGLKCNGVNRLKKTKEKLSENHQIKMKELDRISDPYKSYKILRDIIIGQSPPCVPYIGMYLTDLTFLEDGNPDVIGEDELINWTKRSLYAQIIRQIQVYQLNDYQKFIDEIPSLHKYLMEIKNVSRELDSLYDESLILEPKEQKKKKNETKQSSSSSSSSVISNENGNDVTIDRNDTIIDKEENNEKKEIKTIEKRIRKFFAPTMNAIDCTKFSNDDFLFAVDDTKNFFSKFVEESYEKNEPKNFLDEYSGSIIGDIMRKRIEPLIVHSLKIGLKEEFHFYDYVSKVCNEKFSDLLNEIDEEITMEKLNDQNERHLKLVKFRVLYCKIYLKKKCKVFAELLYNSNCGDDFYDTSISYIAGRHSQFSIIKRRIIGLLKITSSMKIILDDTLSNNEYEILEFE